MKSVADSFPSNPITKGNQDIPEAPCSFTFAIKVPTGDTGVLLPVLYTERFSNREEGINALFDTAKQLYMGGCTPDARRGFSGAKTPPEYIVGRSCPKCGGKLTTSTTKTGKTLIQCEHRKYDFTTKQVSGCDYMEWPESVATQAPQNVVPLVGATPPATTPANPATPRQKAVIQQHSPQNYRDNLTFEEASQIISQNLSK